MLVETIPNVVVVKLRAAIMFLNDAKFSIEQGRNCDRIFGGSGRYEADVVLNKYRTSLNLFERKDKAYRTIEKWRDYISYRGIDIDFDVLISEIGVVPAHTEIYLSGEGFEWLDSLSKA